MDSEGWIIILTTVRNIAIVCALAGVAFRIIEALHSRALRNVVRDFEEKFPDKCFYCGFHRFGYKNGFKKTNEIPPHSPCKEREISDQSVSKEGE